MYKSELPDNSPRIFNPGAIEDGPEVSCVTTFFVTGAEKAGAAGAAGAIAGAGTGTAATGVGAGCGFTGTAVTGCSGALEAGCGDGFTSFCLRHMGFSPSVFGDFLCRGAGVLKP
jgi:hypothetical protein